MCFFVFGSGSANLDEVSGAAVDVDVRQLQTDDLTGLSDQEGSTAQLWLGSHEGELALCGNHVQASLKTSNIVLSVIYHQSIVYPGLVPIC